MPKRRAPVEQPELSSDSDDDAPEAGESYSYSCLSQNLLPQPSTVQRPRLWTDSLPRGGGAVSMSSGREMAVKRRRAEELGRHSVNAQHKARNKRQNDLMVEQARQRAAKAPPAPVPLPEDVLKHMEATEETARKKARVEHPERWVLGMNPRGDESDSDDEEPFPPDEDAEHGLGLGSGGGGGGRSGHGAASALGKHVVWSSDSDDDDVAGSGDGDESEGEGGVKPVVLQDRHTQANKPKTVDFRKQHLYGARLNRQNGLLALTRRTQGRLGSSSRF